MKRLLAALALIAALAPAGATDLPFGGDTLHYLIRESDLAVRGRVDRSPVAAAFGPTQDRYLVHSVGGASVLGGEGFAAASPFSFGVHVSLPIAPGASGDSIVFLKRLDDPTASAMLAPAGTEYVAVSGGYGVVDLAPAGRAEAIDMLIAAGEDAARQREWATTYLRSPDLLLQRSSLHLAYDKIAEPWAGALLIEAIGAPAVSLENRDLAIEMLLEGEVPGTLAALRQLADNGATPLFLRTSAVRTVGRLPEGEAQMAAWAASDDPVLASLVAATRAAPQ
jgi:hypothetical protein